LDCGIGEKVLEKDAPLPSQGRGWGIGFGVYPATFLAPIQASVENILAVIR